MYNLLESMDFQRGPAMKNRFMLAPLTNTQSHENGNLSEEEYHWLTQRAVGGFGLTMTCAAHVQAIGKGFPGQLGVWSDEHISGLKRLADKIKAEGSVSIVQLHHAGMRSPKAVIGEDPVCPSADEETSSRALSNAEVKQLVEDFVLAAERSEQAGFEGVELHGAHGYILCQFLSEETNRRDDEYGGNIENRWRILFEIISGIRSRCGGDFLLGVRLSPERFGLKLADVKGMAERLMVSGDIDFLDMSLWDSFKEPVEEEHKGQSLIEHFAALPRGNTRLGVAGKIRTPAEAERAMACGIDWVMLGRAAILHHDFPNKYQQDPAFVPVDIPVTKAYLNNEGLSDKFIAYMGAWPGFVEG